MERKVELLKSSFSLTMVKILSQFSNYPNSAIYSNINLMVFRYEMMVFQYERGNLVI